MKEIWKAASSSDKAIYIIALLVGLPLSFCWDKNEKNGLLAVWHLLITPFFIAIGLIILKGWVVAVFSTNKDSDQKEISLGFPLITSIIGLVFHNYLLISIGIMLGIISLFTWVKSLGANKNLRT